MTKGEADMNFRLIFSVLTVASTAVAFLRAIFVLLEILT